MKDQDSLDLASQDVRNLLDAFRLLEPFPLYFIGPYGSRISFQSQQIRALNLVHALANDSKANISGKNIAVIGAGVTGMTVAAGLASHNANVHLYEQKSENEDFIGNCSSRYVHPNINFVPEEALSFTTKLPIMNWHADTADSVIIQLKKQLAHHEKSEKNKISRLNFSFNLLYLIKLILIIKVTKKKKKKT